MKPLDYFPRNPVRNRTRIPETGIFCAIVDAPFGALGIRTVANRALREVVYLPPSTTLLAPQTKFAEKAARQVGRYFNDCEFIFDLPLAPAGTVFQQKVWQIIRAIPCGAVLTYSEVAKRLGTAPRAVGQACGANWFPLVIPCHRVTATGGLGGFSNQADANGFHIGVKRWLLAYEGLETYV